MAILQGNLVSHFRNLSTVQQKPGFNFEDKVDSLAHTVEEFQSSPLALRSVDSSQQAVLTVPNRGSLTKTADGFVLSLLSHRPRVGDTLGARTESSYRFEDKLGIIHALEVEQKDTFFRQGVQVTPDPVLTRYDLDLQHGLIAGYQRAAGGRPQEA
jgi:hypothetical protein